jgi:anhydro-N-acetylmuramic acid kinase
MEYNVIGLMSGSSLDGLDIAFVQFEESAGKWQFDIKETSCILYPEEWRKKLSSLNGLKAEDYFLLHTAYGHWIGHRVIEFLEQKNLSYRVQLIASHGHTAFHLPARRMTAQLGDGGAISAVTGVRTISDLRNVDIALGGQGAPIVPIGEKLLLPEYNLFLNIGGIANLSVNGENFLGFDVCPANRVLNSLAKNSDKGFDENGEMASAGQIDPLLLKKLNEFDYYGKSYPKSLSNEFGINEIIPLIEKSALSKYDALATYVRHIVIQVSRALSLLKEQLPDRGKLNLLITGGGAHNKFLVESLRKEVSPGNIECVVPEDQLVDYKEALIIAFMGVLRWREDINVMRSVTGASKDSINGAIWSV